MLWKLWVDQSLPSQLYPPTKVQLVLDGHDTAPIPPGGAGTACQIDQLLPSHRSTSWPALVPPTATQKLIDGHDTQARSLVVAPTGSGTVGTDQLLPSHRSTNSLEAPRLS